MAAYNAAHAHDDDEDWKPTISSPTLRAQVEKVTAASAARAFVSRVFHLPSYMKRAPKEEASKEGEVLYYPIVGFHFCKTDESHSMAVPTSNCNASIRLHPSLEEEPIYGWYTPGCLLGDWNDENYCNEPKQQQEEEEQSLAP